MATPTSAGWRGYHPSYALAVADRHIAIAAAAAPQLAAPITGTVRGNDATSTLRAQIDIVVSEGADPMPHRSVLLLCSRRAGLPRLLQTPQCFC